MLPDKLFAGLEIQYTSDRKTLSGGEVADFVLTNPTLFSQSLFLQGLTLSASLYNLFDSTYDDPGSEEHLQDAIAQNGRSFRLKLVYSF